MSLSQIFLIGNAGRNAELRQTPNGGEVANFSVAISRRYPVRDEMREETEWFNVAVWNRTAPNVAERVKRGSKVFVDGRLSTRQYTDANGRPRTSLDVRANRVIVFDRRNGNGEYGDDGSSFGEGENERDDGTQQGDRPFRLSKVMDVGASEMPKDLIEVDKLAW